jgi:hypothetical protein
LTSCSELGDSRRLDSGVLKACYLATRPTAFEGTSSTTTTRWSIEQAREGVDDATVNSSGCVDHQADLLSGEDVRQVFRGV